MVDARVQRTRTALEDAIFALGAEHPLGTISAAQVCAESGVSRATFYRYARSPASFMRHRLRRVMGAWMEEFLASCDSDDSVQRLRAHDTALTRLWQEFEVHFDFYALNLGPTDQLLMPVYAELHTGVLTDYVRINLPRIELPLVMRQADQDWVVKTLAGQYAHAAVGLTVCWVQSPPPHPLASFLGLNYELMPKWQRRLIGLE